MTPTDANIEIQIRNLQVKIEALQAQQEQAHLQTQLIAADHRRQGQQIHSLETLQAELQQHIEMHLEQHIQEDAQAQTMTRHQAQRRDQLERLAQLQQEGRIGAYSPKTKINGCPTWIEMLQTLTESNELNPKSVAFIQELLGLSMLGYAAGKEKALSILGTGESAAETSQIKGSNPKEASHTLPMMAGVSSILPTGPIGVLRIWRIHGGTPRIEFTQAADMADLVVYSCEFENVRTCDACSIPEPQPGSYEPETIEQLQARIVRQWPEEAEAAAAELANLARGKMDNGGPAHMIHTAARKLAEFRRGSAQDEARIEDLKSREYQARQELADREDILETLEHDLEEAADLTGEGSSTGTRILDCLSLIRRRRGSAHNQRTQAADRPNGEPLTPEQQHQEQLENLQENLQAARRDLEEARHELTFRDDTIDEMQERMRRAGEVLTMALEDLDHDTPLQTSTQIRAALEALGLIRDESTLEPGHQEQLQETRDA